MLPKLFQSKEEADAYLAPRTIRAGKCLVWMLTCNSAMSPVASIKGYRAVAVRRQVFLANGGVELPQHKIMMKCNHDSCLEFKHMVLKSPGEINREIGRRGGYSTMARRMASQKSGRKVSTCTPAIAAEVRRLRSEGRTLKECAALTGVGYTVCSRICRGEAWADLSSGVFDTKGLTNLPR